MEKFIKKTTDDRPAYLCIPVPFRDAELAPHTGLIEMNDYFAKGYKFLFEKNFGPGERYFYFERLDIGKNCHGN
jgi:hypothetical protein